LIFSCLLGHGNDNDIDIRITTYRLLNTMANADDLRPQVLGVMITFWILTWVIVTLRVYVRYVFTPVLPSLDLLQVTDFNSTVMIKSFGRDDVAMIVTLLLFTGYLSCQAAAVTHGIGRHRKDIPEEDLPVGFAAWMFAELFYDASASILKIAVGLFLESVLLKTKCTSSSSVS
jgi:hypothetical protein